MKVEEKVTHVISVEYYEAKQTAVAKYHKTMIHYNDADFYVKGHNELHKNVFRSNTRFYVGLLVPSLDLVKRYFPKCILVVNNIILPNNYIVCT